MGEVKAPSLLLDSSKTKTMHTSTGHSILTVRQFRMRNASIYRPYNSEEQALERTAPTSNQNKCQGHQMIYWPTGTSRGSWLQLVSQQRPRESMAEWDRPLREARRWLRPPAGRRGWIEWKEERSFTGAWAWAFWVVSGPSCKLPWVSSCFQMW